MRLIRGRDNQQWMLDLALKLTGRVQNFERDEREAPPGVKNYRMIPKFWEREAQQLEAIGREAEGRGFRETALEAYFKAADAYRLAVHPIYYDDHPRKLAFHERLWETYDRVIALAPYPIERAEVPFEGKSIPCLFHILPDRRRAPCILYIPGMDSAKEYFPDVLGNVCLSRGFHCLAMDGPGQGTSNIRKIRAVGDSYERAAEAVVSWLRGRPEVDPERIAVIGSSMGSYWALRLAARDGRLAAAAAGVACYFPNHTIFTQSSPRFKQVFMYMAGIADEAEFDGVAEGMTVEGYASRIRCPVLLFAGEFDPLCPLEDSLRVFEELRGAKELWVFEDEFHRLVKVKNLGGMDCYPFVLDWLQGAMGGGLRADHSRVARVRPRGSGPFDPACNWRPPAGPGQPYF